MTITMTIPNVYGLCDEVRPGEVEVLVEYAPANSYNDIIVYGVDDYYGNNYLNNPFIIDVIAERCAIHQLEV